MGDLNPLSIVQVQRALRIRNPPAIAQIQKVPRKRNLQAIVLIQRALRNHRTRAVRVQIKSPHEVKEEVEYEKSINNIHSSSWFTF